MGKICVSNRKKLAFKKKLLAAWMCSVIMAAALYSTQHIRRYGVRPLNRRRPEYGHYKTLFKFRQSNDEEQFFKYTRLSILQIRKLLSLIEHRLKKCTDKDHIQHILPEERLAVTLDYLSEGCSRQQLAWNYLMGITTVHKIVTETSKIIWEELNSTYLKPLTGEDWTKVEEGFQQDCDMSNCIGAVNGKHRNIQAPKNSGSDFFNY